MDCDRFLEEKLSGTESPEFRAHLASCEACRRDVEEYAEVRRLYREASVERYPGAVPQPRRFASRSWVPSLAAAVLLGVLLLALFGGPAEVPPGGSGAGEPAVAGFFRVYLAPWDAQDVRWNEEARNLWERLESFEGRRR